MALLNQKSDRPKKMSESFVSRYPYCTPNPAPPRQRHRVRIKHGVAAPVPLKPSQPRPGIQGWTFQSQTIPIRISSLPYPNPNSPPYPPSPAYVIAPITQDLTNERKPKPSQLGVVTFQFDKPGPVMHRVFDAGPWLNK